MIRTGARLVIRFPYLSLFILLLTVLNIVFNLINHKFFLSDFKVYYDAAGNFLAGGRVYFTRFGESSGFYKYSPLTLLYFIPFSLLKYKTAAILHILILGFAYRQTYLNTRDLITKFFYRTTVISEQWILILAVVGTMIFFVKEVYLGNINIILICLALLALKYLIEGKNRRFGMVFTLVILTKPFFGLLILPLIFRKDIPAMLYILFGIIAGLLIPSVFYGFEKNLILISDWINTMVIHDSSFPSVNSIDYLTHRYFFPNLSAYFEMVILLAFIAAFFLCKWIQVRKIDFSQLADTQSLVIEWFIILALIPNLFKMDTEHFLASIPLITFLVYFIAVNRKYLLIPLMVVLIFFFGGNSQDLLGKEFSGFLFQLGLIGISNLLMVLMLLILYIRKSGS